LVEFLFVELDRMRSSRDAIEPLFFAAFHIQIAVNGPSVHVDGTMGCDILSATPWKRRHPEFRLVLGVLQAS
jgi:hypothetical protein